MSDYPEFDPTSENIVNREVIEPEATPDIRSLARRVALQVLYQLDSAHHPIAEVLRYYVVIDDVSGKIIELDPEIAAMITGTVRQLDPTSDIAQRIQQYRQVFDTTTGTAREIHTETALSVHRLVKYLEAEPHILRLSHGVVAHRDRLDVILQTYAPEFPINQVAIVDRNILRLALYEIGIEAQTPTSVAIDEAVNLAQLFGAEGSPRFVNGVLGNIFIHLDEVRTTLQTHISSTPE
jgi:transcription antitermination factor NusB